MTGKNSYAGLDPYLVKLVRIKVHRLIGHYGYTEADRLDLQQDLMVAVLRKMKGFSPDRGKPSTYMVRIVDGAIKDIIRIRMAQRRSWSIYQASLDEESPEDLPQDPALLMDSVRSADMVGREGLDVDEGEAAALRIDLERVLDTLPADLRAICERLKEVSLTALSRETGIPRTTLFHKRKQIHRAFAEAGLQIYLKKNPTD